MIYNVFVGWWRKICIGLMLITSLTAQAANSDVDSLVAGNDAFALDLYARLANTNGNLFFSPYSISTALAMTYDGARGETARQMAKTLHFDLNLKKLASVFGDMQRQLNGFAQKTDVQMNVANGLWAQQGHPFLSPFLDNATKKYEARLKQVDFLTQAVPACKEVNDWVDQQTKGKILDLLSPDLVDESTRLILVNAIYFKGQWTRQFNKEQTVDVPFSISPTQTAQAPMMSMVDRFNYAALNGLQLLELPYGKGELSFVALLPAGTNGLRELESSLSPQLLQDWLSQAHQQKVRVFLPRFKMTAQFNLAKTLGKMGMPDAFSSDADFSGMDGTKLLCLSAVVHKAFVDINEEGTEAAASTAVIAVLKGAAPDPLPIFRADHPFIFLIRDTHSGSILFLGRLVDPNKA